MTFDAFLFFDGDCREAVAFYATVFDTPVDQLMTYGQLPDAKLGGIDSDRVLYCALQLPDTTLMCSDRPSGTPHVRGNNVGLTLGWTDEAAIRDTFAKLAEGGEISMELGPTFFSPLYGMVTDKFGIIWQFSQTGQAAPN